MIRVDRIPEIEDSFTSWVTAESDYRFDERFVVRLKEWQSLEATF